jgi:hypothetical protein
MKIEDDHFWPAEKTRFWIYVLIVTTIFATLAFAIWGWVLCQQKVNMNSNQQSTTPPPTTWNGQNPDAITNASSLLSPSELPTATNSN